MFYVYVNTVLKSVKLLWKPLIKALFNVINFFNNKLSIYGSGSWI